MKNDFKDGDVLERVDGKLIKLGSLSADVFAAIEPLLAQIAFEMEDEEKEHDKES